MDLATARGEQGELAVSSQQLQSCFDGTAPQPRGRVKDKQTLIYRMQARGDKTSNIKDKAKTSIKDKDKLI